VVSRCSPPGMRLPFLHQYFRWSYELATHPRILDAVESVLGPDLLVWGTLLLSKPPGSRVSVPWHQDLAYSGFLGQSPAVSAWVALTEVTPENGCLRVIPGSHGTLLPFTDKQDADDMLKRGQRVLADIDEKQCVNITLRPGEASLHETSLVHGSTANRSTVPRTGFIIRFATPAIRQPEAPVYCVRGDPGEIDCSAQLPDSDDGYRAYANYLSAESGTRKVED
jgi:non-heme Fe2+,alpha-ketoglutarate-dependent halogenase